MRSKIFIAISLLLLSVTRSVACGWVPSTAGEVMLYRIMPIDESDYLQYSSTCDCDVYFNHSIDYRKENIAMWQQQTSQSIRPADIDSVVYEAGIRFLKSNKNNINSKNSFVRWLARNHRKDVFDYLILAKQCQYVISSMDDPWYYSVNGDDQSQKLENIIAQSKKHRKGLLSGRYALQMVRALCTLRRYEECVEFWNSIKNSMTDNVIRKMVALKAARAIYKAGNKQEALKIYAKYGDIASIRSVNGGDIENELEYVYNLYPNSPYIEGELQTWLFNYGTDWVASSIKNNSSGYYYTPEKHIKKIIKVAKRAIREKKSKKQAMWYYTIAALYDTMGDAKTALKYLRQGEDYEMTPYLRDSYHVLRMWLDAKTANYNEEYEQRLMSDLKWLDRKIPNEVPSSLDLEQFPQNEYAKNVWEGGVGYQEHPNTCYWNDAMRRILLREVCPHMHKVGKHTREIQLANMAENRLVKINAYCNEMFVIMDRHSYNTTKEYFSRIYSPKNEFDKFLNNKGKTDKFYWYDILATKCLREQRYSKAIVYLKQIPLKFQEGMDVYDYMGKDPFSYDKETIKKNPMLAGDYKLHFAEQMVKHHYAMKHEKNRDKRADAIIQYALGLRNSVHECWVLTRYSSNYCDEYVKYTLPNIAYPEDSTIYRYKSYMKLSDKLINKAIITYKDKEKAASQLRKFLYYKRIMKYYGDTKTAIDIRLHCDKWRDYVNN